MYQKASTMEKPRPKIDSARIKKLVRKVEEARKDPEFKAFIKEFITYHTGSK